MAKRKRGSVLLGFFGALVGALVGAVVWAAVYAFGYVASIVGLLIGFLSGKGYDLCNGRRGSAKIAVLIICVIIAVAVGNLGAYAWILHSTYQDEIAAMTAMERHLAMSEAEFMEMAVQDLIGDSEFIANAVKDLGVGLLFAFLGAFSTLRNAGGKKKQRKKPAAEE